VPAKIKSLVGQTFGELTVVRMGERTGKRNRVTWVCRCSCGNEVQVTASNLIRAGKFSHTCKNHAGYGLVGKRFDRLFVLRRSTKRTRYGGAYWECRCDCGNTAVVLKQALINGSIRSCGCLKKEKETRFEGISGNYWGSLKASALKRRLEFSISIKQAWDLYNSQKARCALSGVPILFGHNQTASLDRVDSNLGYVLGNVQWLHKDVNRIKSDFSEFDLTQWCARIYLTSLKNLNGDDKWDMRFLQLARFMASFSKDPSTQTGAAIIRPDRTVVSVGYNGLARGVQDSPERLNNREIKYKVICHCERNAIVFARQDVGGCTLYTWPFMSCAACAAIVIQAGIKRCVAPRNDNPRWQEDFKLAQQQFAEAGVTMDFTDSME